MPHWQNLIRGNIDLLHINYAGWPEDWSAGHNTLLIIIQYSLITHKKTLYNINSISLHIYVGKWVRSISDYSYNISSMLSKSYFWQLTILWYLPSVSKCATNVLEEAQGSYTYVLRTIWGKKIRDPDRGFPSIFFSAEVMFEHRKICFTQFGLLSVSM